MSVIKEFKDFISRGSVIDMAVGVVIGGAFNNIVTAFTNNILTPVISCLTGKVNIQAWAFKVSDELIIPYGEFLQSVINFLLTAAVLFAFIKLINSVRRSMDALCGEEKEPPKEEEAKPSVEDILCEIRDMMKNEN